MMAQTVQITKENDITKIVVDGNEITDVVSYEMKEQAGAPAILYLSFLVNAVEVQR